MGFKYNNGLIGLTGLIGRSSQVRSVRPVRFVRYVHFTFANAPARRYPSDTDKIHISTRRFLHFRWLYGRRILFHAGGCSLETCKMAPLENLRKILFYFLFI